MTHIKRTLKLPPLRIKRYWGSPTISFETNNRNGNNGLLFRMNKGQVTQRSKHFYYLQPGFYKDYRIQVLGVDLVE